MATKKKAAAKKAAAKKATAKKATAKKATAKKVARKNGIVKRATPKKNPISLNTHPGIITESAKAVFPTFPRPVEKSSSEILKEILASIHGETNTSESSIQLFDDDSPLQSPNVVTRLTGRRHLPILIICLLIAALIAGFWGKQIVESIGIPINGGNYTSIYFQDPTIVQKGLVSGDLLVFGIHNGSDKSRNLGWHVNSGPLTIARGVVKLAGNSDSYVQISTSGALSGAKIEAFVDGTSTPITVEVVG